jgi:protein-tyrosine phosphatase
MSDGFRVLTLCKGNVHRSALAAAVLRRWAHWYLPAELEPHVTVASAGFGAPVGAPMDDRVAALTRALGADGGSHRATQVTDSMLSSADLVLVATRRQVEEVLKRAPASLRKTFTVREAGRIAERLDSRTSPASVSDLSRVVERLANARGLPEPKADDIIDPQGLGDDAYLQMAHEEIGPLAWIGSALFGMPRPDLTAYLAAGEDPAALLGSSARRWHEE